jgi:hypothetical protein
MRKASDIDSTHQSKIPEVIAKFRNSAADDRR